MAVIASSPVYQTGIYTIVNKVNGKYYIGSTAQSFMVRWCKHKSSLRAGKHHSSHLQAAWTKYGESNFEFKILEIVPKEEWIDNRYLTDIEQIYLDTYKPDYNILPTAGSNLGRVWTDETKLKISESLSTFNKNNPGRTIPEERKLRISETQKGISRPQTSKEKNGMYGKKREDLSSFNHQTKSKKWEVENPFGEFIEVFNLKAFCREYNLQSANLIKVADGKYSNHKGYKCKRLH